MLDERKSKILRAIVREYIETAQPVGSAHVASDVALNVSPATIRNEMAVLEQEGYLRQPHTSAGRIPTDKAYRVYVDQITEPGVLDEIHSQQVREFFNTAHGALERMLQHTTGLLTRLTSYTAVVTAAPADVAKVRSAQLVSLSEQSLMAVAVLSNGTVESATLDRSPDMSDAAVNAATALLGRHAVGRSLAHLDESVIGAPAGTNDDPATALARRALDALRGRARHPDEHLYVGGTASVASAFEAVEVVRGVLATLEQEYVVVSLLRDMLDRGASVAIGSEHGIEQLAACSVVVAPYIVEGEAVGTVGLLGPTRMNYPQALVAVDVVSQRLSERLADG
jgi:heat-inducible transcriptional repressor